MKTFNIPVFSISLSLLLMQVACSSSSKKETQKNETDLQEDLAEEETDQKRIVFFGNSITAGYQLDPKDAFPNLIQEKIDSVGLKYEVVNAGLSGETTAGGVERVDWILKGNVNIFVLELGANDGLRGLPLNETEKNLKTIIEKVRTANPNVKILLLGMEVPPNMGDDYAQEFRSTFKQVAQDKEVAFMPFLLKDVAGKRELNLPDGIHPTEKGHRIVANNVWPYVKDLL